MMLHLVPKTLLPFHLDAFSQKHDWFSKTQEPLFAKFLSDFHEASQNLFSFQAHNARYDLHCSTLLELQVILITEDEVEFQCDSLIPMLVGDFPMIDEQKLHDKVFGDEYLQKTLMTQFYLNVLESLLLACEEKKASGLILTVDDRCHPAVEVFRNHMKTETEVCSEQGNQTQITILASQDTYEKLSHFMEKIDHEFCRTLWRNHGGNPILRQHLKYHAVV
ncbi:MAG: hypothetical protein K2Y18_01650 [Alphaproteobacteria bacterium]|nr:hypothetical protein [Alphaproteobacteria bacterium]